MRKGSQLNKESVVSNEQGIPAEEVVREFEMNKGSQLKKESGV